MDLPLLLILPTICYYMIYLIIIYPNRAPDGSRYLLKRHLDPPGTHPKHLGRMSIQPLSTPGFQALISLWNDLHLEPLLFRVMTWLRTGGGRASEPSTGPASHLTVGIGFFQRRQ